MNPAHSMLFMDVRGGFESQKPSKFTREQGGYTYEFVQTGYDPLSNLLSAHINFKMKDGSVMHEAFSFQFRMYTIPELREMIT